MRCQSCTADLVHCHGTLLQHADGSIECTDDTCPGTDRVFHELRIVCEVSEQGCYCLLALSA